MNIRQAVVFAIIVQTNGQIKYVEPEYLLEKLRACEQMPIPEGLLDDKNYKIFEEYQKMWDLDWDKERDLKYSPKDLIEIDKTTGEFI